MMMNYLPYYIIELPILNKTLDNLLMNNKSSNLRKNQECYNLSSKQFQDLKPNKKRN